MAEIGDTSRSAYSGRPSPRFSVVAFSGAMKLNHPIMPLRAGRVQPEARTQASGAWRTGGVGNGSPGWRFETRAERSWSPQESSRRRLTRGQGICELLRLKCGGMGEWLKPAVLKTVSLERGSGVRIPLPPSKYLYHHQSVGTPRLPQVPLVYPSFEEPTAPATSQRRPPVVPDALATHGV